MRARDLLHLEKAHVCRDIFSISFSIVVRCSNFNPTLCMYQYTVFDQSTDTEGPSVRVCGFAVQASRV